MDFDNKLELLILLFGILYIYGYIKLIICFS